MSGPPRLAERLLHRVLPPHERDFILGDLFERYAAIAEESDVRARIWYWRQALAACVQRMPGPLDSGESGSFEALKGDVRSALRSLVRRPRESLACALTLGLGIGVVGTAFSILHGTVLRGLPFEDADRLVHFERANVQEGLASLAVTPHDYMEWRAAQTSFEDLGAYVEASAILPVEGAPPERYLGVRISAASFELLRVEPSLGRSFDEADERPGAPPVVLLSHALWQSRFAADPSVVGSDIPLNDVPTTVIGIMPEGFGFPIAERFWLPLRLDMGAMERGQGRLDVFGRLRDEVSIGVAGDDVARIGLGLAESYPETNAGVTPVLRSFHDEYVGPDFTRTTVRMLVGAVLVLLVCCANVANLLLIRGARRRADLALRVSLGATSGRIVRQLMVEASVLAAAGAALGMVLAQYGVAWFDIVGAQAGVFALPHGSDSLFWWDVSVDATTMVVVVGVAAATSLAAGVVPAVWASRAASAGVLRMRAATGHGSGAMGRLSATLVVAQLALTTGLLVVAGLVTRSAVNVAAADDVITSEGLFVARVALPYDGGAYTSDDERLGLAERLLARMVMAPEVEAAALGSSLPLATPHAVLFALEGGPVTGESVPDGAGGSGGDGAEGVEVGVVSVTPHYFELFGVGLVEGRAFDPSDDAAGSPVAVVNRSFVSRHLGDRSPVGTRIRLGDANASEPWVTIIGVVSDLWERPLQPEREAGVYLPVAQSRLGDPSLRLGRLGLRVQTFVVRGRPGVDAVPQAVRTAVYETDGSLPLRDLRTMDEVVRQQMGRYRVWGRFYLAFAIAGLLLASMGVYGVLTFSVTQRTSEIGVRRALGASGGSVWREVMGAAGKQVLVGSAVGLAVGAALSSGVARILYGVDTLDPAVFAFVAAAVGAVALLASWIPARRAAAVDPIEAIRND